MLIANLNTLQMYLSWKANLLVKDTFLGDNSEEEAFMEPPSSLIINSTLQFIQVKEGLIWVQTIPKRMV